MGRGVWDFYITIQVFLKCNDGEDGCLEHGVSKIEP